MIKLYIDLFVQLNKIFFRNCNEYHFQNGNEPSKDFNHVPWNVIFLIKNEYCPIRINALKRKLILRKNHVLGASKSRLIDTIRKSNMPKITIIILFPEKYYTSLNHTAKQTYLGCVFYILLFLLILSSFKVQLERNRGLSSILYLGRLQKEVTYADNKISDCI